jgi:hypothetical protein
MNSLPDSGETPCSSQRSIGCFSPSRPQRRQSPKLSGSDAYIVPVGSYAERALIHSHVGDTRHEIIGRWKLEPELPLFD